MVVIILIIKADPLSFKFDNVLTKFIRNASFAWMELTKQKTLGGLEIKISLYFVPLIELNQ